MPLGKLVFCWVAIVLALPASGVSDEPTPSAGEFDSMTDAEKKKLLIKTYRKWNSDCQNIIARTTHQIRHSKIPMNSLWLSIGDIDKRQKPRAGWRCNFFRLDGEFGKTKFESTTFPVGLTHRSRTSCLPSASSNTENFNRFAFWLKSEFGDAIHFPFFEMDRYENDLSFLGLNEEQLAMIKFPVHCKNKAVKVERTMWLDAANGFLPAKAMTAVTRDTRAGESVVFGITVVAEFRSVNGVVVPVEFYEYAVRPSTRDRSVLFFHTMVDEIKIRRRS